MEWCHLKVYHLLHTVSLGWLIQTRCQWESADSSPCLVCQRRWDLESYCDNSTGGDQNMEAPSAFIWDWKRQSSPLNSNTSSTSKPELFWLHTKQTICLGEILIEPPSLPVRLIFTKLLFTFWVPLCLYSFYCFFVYLFQILFYASFGLCSFKCFCFIVKCFLMFFLHCGHH